MQGHDVARARHAIGVGRNEFVRAHITRASWSHIDTFGKLRLPCEDLASECVLEMFKGPSVCIQSDYIAGNPGHSGHEKHGQSRVRHAGDLSLRSVRGSIAPMVMLLFDVSCTSVEVTNTEHQILGIAGT